MKTFDEQLQEADYMLGNGQNQLEIQEAMLLFGYTEEKFAEGVLLRDEARQLSFAWERMHGEKEGATATVLALWGTMQTLYVSQRQIAKMALAQDAKRQKGLLLHKPCPRLRQACILQATLFYENALADEAVLAALGRFNVTAVTLTAAQAQLAEVVHAEAALVRAKAEAQRATAVRQAAFRALAVWVGEFRRIARIALGPQSPLLVSLGIKPRK